ncbi:MAG: DUF3883 domain-containing protein, partial [Gammaproteobacteria bacterium]|nr:DUF3883 domain-containing protein [Gammaproteobacteria bacterium]
QIALRPRLGSLPIIRLANGSHVAPSVDGEIQAFLPGPVETDFPTVRKNVCQSENAREFLRSLSLTEPDPVDNVIRNVLPKYREAEDDISKSDYAADIERMLTAAATDSQSQRDKLVRALQLTPWVKAVDAGGGQELMARPKDVYVATERLRELFAGIKDVLIVDSRVACLRGEAIRELLERTGASRYLHPVEVDCDLLPKQLREIRRKEGLERETWREINDVGIRGLDMLLERLPALESEERIRRATSLWNALRDLHERSGAGTFEGTYKWGFHQERKVATFDAVFIHVLNDEQWIPDPSGALREPASITFDKVGWRPNGFLESKIRFKPPLVEQLAQEVGIEPGVLDLLRQLGVTSEAELRQRLDLEDELSALPAAGLEHNKTEEKAPPSETGDGGLEPLFDGDENDKSMLSEEVSGNTEETGPDRDNEGSEEEMSSRSQLKPYVSVIGEEVNSDPDALEYARRMELEGSAIEFILGCEPDWQRTLPNNRGFDLYRGIAMEAATEWCEVKAMTGTLKDRPVGMSKVQFEWARKHGEAFWLYVVERAGSKDMRIVRIQDPAGKATAFTFDDSWRTMAVIDTSPKAHS